MFQAIKFEISDPIYLQASMTAICCVFHQMSTSDVEILLGTHILKQSNWL